MNASSATSCSEVDFHVRLAPVPEAAKRLCAALDRAGTERAVVVAGGVLRPVDLSRHLVEGGHTEDDPDNRAVLDAADESGGRLVPAYFGNPHRDPDDYLAVADSYVGLELSPAVHGTGFADPLLEVWVRAAGTVGHWVYAVAINRPGCRVEDFAALARRHPGTTFVLGHLGYGNIDYHGIATVADVPNVCVESSGGYSTVLAVAVEQLGAERVLYGSEYPLQDPRVERLKVDVLELDPDSRAAVMGGNARRILKEEQ